MVHVIIIGDQKFYRDAMKTRREAKHYMLDAVGDISQSIATLARHFAPGRLGETSVGTTHPISSGNIYRAEVGVREVPKHAKFVHGGTGIFGPRKAPYTITKKQTQGPPITPNWGLDRTGHPNPAVGNVFKITSGRGEIYFRKRVTVMGQRPQPYLIEAYELAKRTEIPIRVKRLVHQFVKE